ncbi:MAG: short-chain dehydrogenase, partial [Cyanobacteria bacterium J06576_12]
GIQVTCLCPGPTQSNFGQVAGMNKIPAMGKLSNDKFPTAHTVAEYGYQCLKKGKVVAVHGTLNKILTFTPRLMPRKLLRDGIKKIMSGE